MTYYFYFIIFILVSNIVLRVKKDLLFFPSFFSYKKDNKNHWRVKRWKEWGGDESLVFSFEENFKTEIFSVAASDGVLKLFKAISQETVFGEEGKVFQFHSFTLKMEGRSKETGKLLSRACFR